MLKKGVEFEDLKEDEIQQLKNLAGELEPLSFYKPSYTHDEHLDVLAESAKTQMKHHHLILKRLEPLREVAPTFENAYREIYHHAVKEGMRPFLRGTSYPITLDFIEKGIMIALPAPPTVSGQKLIETANSTYGADVKGGWITASGQEKDIQYRFRPRYLTHEALMTAAEVKSIYDAKTRK